MTSFYVYIISFFIFIISYKLFKIAGGSISITKINTVSYVFYYGIILSTFIGSIYVILNDFNDHWILCHVQDETKVYSWLCVCYSMIAMPLGMIFLCKACKINAQSCFESYLVKKIYIKQSSSHLKNILLGMTIFSLLIAIYIYINSNSWPFYTALIEKDFESSLDGRIEVRRNFQGIIYIKNLMGLYLVPTFSYFSYIILLNKRKFVFMIYFLLLVILSLFIIVYDTQKAPAIFYLLGFLVIRVLVKGKISGTLVFVFVIAALFFISLFYIVFAGSNHAILDILLNPKSSLWGRLFISGYAGVPLSFEWFPNVINQPTWQIGLPDFILNFCDMPTNESARLMMLKINPAGNLISSYYISEAWANYGVFGVLISPFIVGMVIQSVHLFLLTHPKTPLIIAFYAAITTKWVVSSGFVNFLYLKVIIFPIILYYIVNFFINRLKK